MSYTDVNDRPTLGKIHRHNGVAGQISYAVEVAYPDEYPSTVEFVGSVYGGSVLMRTESFRDGVFVTDPERFGQFGPEWVRKFFSQEV